MGNKIAIISLMALIISVASIYYGISLGNHISELESQIELVMATPDINNVIIRHQIVKHLDELVRDYPYTLKVVEITPELLLMLKDKASFYYPAHLPNKTLYEVTRANPEGVFIHIVYDYDNKEILNKVVMAKYVPES